MGDFVTVCPLAEMQPDTPRTANIEGVDIVLVLQDETVYALADSCSHADVPLSEGTVDDDCTIECWLHGSRFDLRTGEPQEPPAFEPVATYETRIQDSAVQVRI